MKLIFLKQREIKIFLTIWLIYIFFLSGYGGNWMANSMLAGTISLVDNHNLIIDEYVNLKGIQESTFSKNHYYSGFAPGSTFLAAPIYLIFKPVFNLLPEQILNYQNYQLKLILLNILATIFITSLSSALLSILIYRLLKNFIKKEKLRLLIIFTFAFGTLFFISSVEYTSRVTATFFIFWAFSILFNIKHRSRININRKLFFAGLFSSMAVFIDYTQALLVIILFIYLLTFLKNKKILFFIIGGLPLLIALFGYHYFIFNDPFTTSYLNRAHTPTNSYFEGGFYGIAYPKLIAIWGLSFSPEKGFFFYMPFFILSLIGFFIVLKTKNHKYKIENIFALSAFLIFFFTNASMGLWQHNCSFGPRFLTSSIPFMLIPLTFVLEKINKIILMILAGISIFINSLGALYGIDALWTGACWSKSPLIKEYLPLLFKRGITNYTLNLIKEKIYNIPVYIINSTVILGLIILIFIIYLIWEKL